MAVGRTPGSRAVPREGPGGWGAEPSQAQGGLQLKSASPSVTEGTAPPASPSTLNATVSFATHSCGCFWSSGDLRHGGLCSGVWANKAHTRA